MSKQPHYEHILAVDKAMYAPPLEPGFNPMPYENFIWAAMGALTIGRREELEQNESYGQLIPYATLYQRTDAGCKVFTVQRAKGVGENRLLGKKTIGMAGHMDLLDLVHNKAVVDLKMSVAKALRRELGEEIGFKNELGHAISYDEAQLRYAAIPKFLGVINDTGDEVGRVHYGLWYVQEVPQELTPFTLEEELQTIGMLPPTMLVEDEQLEGWSKIVLEQIHEALK